MAAKSDSLDVKQKDLNKWIRLNIGGVLFFTSRTNLEQNSDYFRALLSGQIPTDRDETGAYMIDRDGELFRPLLNYFRSGRVSIPPGFSPEDLQHEAEFYMAQIPEGLLRPPSSASSESQPVGYARLLFDAPHAGAREVLTLRFSSGCRSLLDSSSKSVGLVVEAAGLARMDSQSQLEALQRLASVGFRVDTVTYLKERGYYVYHLRLEGARPTS